PAEPSSSLPADRYRQAWWLRMEKPERARGVATLRARAPTREFSMPTIREYSTPADNPGRLADLKALQTEYAGSRDIEIVPGDANSALLALLGSGFSKKTHRAYIFLDPFGIQVPWKTIEALAATKAIEVMINFPMGMAIRRMMPRTGDVPPGWGISLDTFFGTPDWRDHAYEEVTDLGGTRTAKFADSEVRLLEWYRSRLQAAFGFVSRAQLITNTRGGHLYYLIWAGPRVEGLKGADYILTMKPTGTSGRKPMLL
ncbi:three-Cys-motif partner protein TcmP, partial [Methylorubrum extorquens]